jgi:hypothetical protein
MLRRVASVAAVAAAVAAPAAYAAVPTPVPPVVSMPGLDSTQSIGVNPADVQVAAGPGSLVEAVNTSVAVWATTVNPPALRRQQTLGAFFSSPAANRVNDQMTDPRIVFDPVSGRFFAVAFDVSRLELVVGVSASSDPAGAWTVYPLPSTGCPDQPRLGTSDAVVIVSDDLFTSCRGFGLFLGGEVNVLSKQDLLNGAATPQRTHFGPDRRFAAITPAQSLSPTPIEYLLAVDQQAGSLSLVHVDNATPASLPVQTITLDSPLRAPDEAPQAGSASTVDVGDNRVQNAVWEDGRLWLTASEACANAACARVIELATPSGAVVVARTLALPSGRALLYPAVVPDRAGNAVLAFEYSSPADAPSLAYAYMRPDGTFSAPVDVMRGTAPNTSGRYGDYSGAARDAGNPARMWIAGEVGSAVNGTTFAWASGVAAVELPPQPPAILGTRVTAGTLTSEVYPEGAATTVRLEYGATAAYGKTLALGAVPAAVRSQALSRALSALPRGTRLHARVVATNANGTTQGGDVAFTTPAAAPVVSYPRVAVSPAPAGATLRAVVTPRGAATTVVFEVGLTRTYGRRATVQVSATSPARTVTVKIGGLVHGRTYHFRVVATNARGRATARDRTFRAG